MNYRVELESVARRELRSLPPPVVKRIDAALQLLAENPLPRGVVRVRGKVGNGWRIRVGDYRILYTIDHDEHLVQVYRIDARDSAYRRLR